MNYLENWKNYIPSKERLYSLLALVVVLAIGVGNLLFITFSIIPSLGSRRKLVAQLASAEQDLMEAQRSQEHSPEKLKEQVATAQATLDEAANVFLSESQAADMLNRLYQYAGESSVEIANLQTQPGSEEKKDLYDVRTFKLQVEGALSNLMDFISRIKEAAMKSFVVTNVNIAAGEGLHTLTMDVTLYTSPYSSGAAVQAAPTVIAAPPATSADLTQLDEALSAAWASGEWEQAIGLIEQMLAIDPLYDDLIEKLYTAYVNYGHQLLEEGDTGGAATQFNLALGIKPDGEEAQAGLQQAVATPIPTSSAEEQLAQRLDEAWAAEDWEKAISLIEQIQAINPDYDDMTEKLYAAHVSYGHKLAAEGKLEEAKEAFISALAIKPDGEEAMAGLQELAGEVVAPSPSPIPISTPQYIIYEVRQGDTLSSIAEQYGTTVEEIMAINGLTDFDVHEGQRLCILTP